MAGKVNMQEAIDALSDAKMMSRASRKQSRKCLKLSDYSLRQSRRCLRLLEANMGCGTRIVKAMLGEAGIFEQK